jgi:hypothetical protein
MSVAPHPPFSFTATAGVPSTNSTSGVLAQCVQTLVVDPIRCVHFLGAQNTFGKTQMVRTPHTVGARIATQWSIPMWSPRVGCVRFGFPVLPASAAEKTISGQNCGTRPVYIENGQAHDYCGLRCANEASNGGSRFYNERRSNTARNKECKYAGCYEPVYVDRDGFPSQYCSQAHRR